MNTKKLSTKIYILPYIYTSIFLIYFFISGKKSYLSFFSASVLYTTIILIVQSILLKLYNKRYGKNFCDIFKISLRQTILLSFAFLLTCIFLFIMNYYSSCVTVNKIIIYLFALLYAVFPLNFLLFSLISFFRTDAEFKRNKIYLCNPESTYDIYNSKLLIIDKIENFTNLNLLNELCEVRTILLTSDLTQEQLKTKLPFLSENSVFSSMDKTNLSSFEKNRIYVFPNTNISSLLSIIRLLNKNYILVSEKEMSALCCKISVTRAADFNIPEKDVRYISTITHSISLLYNRYKKCISYMITLSIAKILASFLCIFFCRELPFSPVMLLFANLICEILPPSILILDNIQENNNYFLFRERLGNIFLDGLLLSIICFIIFMLSSINFSKSCANIMCINTYIISVLLYSVNMRSEKNIFIIGLLTNKFTAISFLAGISAVITVTALIYNATTPISASAWLLVISMAFIPFIVNQLQKIILDLYKK